VGPSGPRGLGLTQQPDVYVVHIMHIRPSMQPALDVLHAHICCACGMHDVRCSFDYVVVLAANLAQQRTKFEVCYKIELGFAVQPCCWSRGYTWGVHWQVLPLQVHGRYVAGHCTCITVLNHHSVDLGCNFSQGVLMFMYNQDNGYV
jgi:hypothetical protein